MGTRTRLELIHQVLDNLGVLVPGQAPSDEDVDKVDKVIDPTVASLQAREIVYISDTGTPSPPTGGEIDDAIFLPTADVVTDRCTPSFNMAGDAQLRVLATQALDELRVIGRPPRTLKTLQCDAGVRTQHTRGTGNFTSGT